MGLVKRTEFHDHEDMDIQPGLLAKEKAQLAQARKQLSHLKSEIKTVSYTLKRSIEGKNQVIDLEP